MQSILVISKEKNLKNKVLYALLANGFRVHTVEEEEEAMALLRKEHVDLIFADMLSRAGNGIESIKEIALCFPKIKIIALSGSSLVCSDEFQEWLDQLKVNGLLAYPFNAKLPPQMAYDILREKYGSRILTNRPWRKARKRTERQAYAMKWFPQHTFTFNH